MRADGGLGIPLPSLPRVTPQLAVPAALGCAALQLRAIAFHLFRPETDVASNAALLLLAAVVARGRPTAVPVPGRT
ncbi:DoxX family protein [Marinitenerispora sediminis]|uniref:DoxX family protein n=1 Tax=Marinitenerispora sediminis TaxID=1931232 RepID=UPI001C6A542B|nr:DoxX family protein [Marinitenerispora sediminis]